MRIEVFARRTLRGRRWFFRMIAKNGKIVAQSEGYHNRIDALETIKTIKRDAAEAPVKILV